MIISDESISSLNLKGIYSITSKDGKRYIGHAKKSFLSRFKQHVAKLQCDWHQNRHLQSAWNLHKSESFVFEVLEVLQEADCFDCKESEWIEKFESWDRLKGYNINRNPGRSPSLTPESRKLISDTLKRRYKNGEIKLQEATFIKPGTEPWNKGKKYLSTNHLKVPKTITEKVIQKGKNQSDRLREGSAQVQISTTNGEVLGIWRSGMDLQEWSQSDLNNLPIESIRVKPGIPRKWLQNVNIQKSCKTGKPYKGLIFKFHAPLPGNG